jgi:phage shock protein A
MPKPSITRRTISWLCGDNAGRVSAGAWNWLWGKSVASGGEIAVAIASESFIDIQRSVHQLTESVAKITATYLKVKEKYAATQKEFQLAEQEAQLANQLGKHDLARIAMGKALLLEGLLPQLKEQMLAAEKILTENRSRLRQEKQRLEDDRNTLEGSKLLAEFNQALEQIQNINNEIDIDSPRSHLNSAADAIHDRYLQVNAMAELSKDPHAEAMSDLSQIIREDEIKRRLKELEDRPSINLYK